MKEFHYEQVLKVWDILPLEEIQKLIVRLDTIFNSYSEDFINCCKVKCLDGNLEVPMNWPISHDIVRYKNINNAIFDSDSGGCERVKNWNDQEREIILFPKSSFILGRSGTGKTTVLTMKLHRKIEQYCIASNGFISEERGMSLSNSADVSHCHSSSDVYNIHSFASVRHFASGGQFYADKSSYDMDDIDEMAKFHDIPDTFVGIHYHKYPLVITFHKFLMMLDGSVGIHSECTRKDVFKDYEKMKTKYCEYDLADLVMNLYFRLNNENLQGEKMDFVYVDEVQDLTTTQIALFSYICKNVDEGFVFSGDTAQTIAKGGDFRFEDVRSLFYNEFVMKSKKFRFPRREKGLLSDNFILFQNFHTHSGVLKLAQSVIDFLSHFFPQSFDVLPPETSFINGEPPIVIELGSNENAIITIFGGSGNVDTKMVGFDTEQVILVRDDSVKKKFLIILDIKLLF
ncbi:Uncharacterized protein Adt_03908 [Abeliophyllum distichum]|uniref:UvrD-like helicase ATP-binding domain-containing protein n=1 Tax=Abeliophyllum distichum TaxID=126358 RepID=A0ABD1W382_9LAMI